MPLGQLPVNILVAHKPVADKPIVEKAIVEKTIVEKTIVQKMEKRNRRLGRAEVCPLVLVGAFVLSSMVAPLVQARTKEKLSYGEGLIVNVPFPEVVVEQVVQDVAQNGIIRGTKEYNKDEYVTGAQATDSTRVFPKWTEGG